MSFEQLKEAARNYSAIEYPEEFGPGKKFLNKEHMDRQRPRSREIVENYFLAGATYGIALNNVDPTKVVIDKSGLPKDGQGS